MDVFDTFISGIVCARRRHMVAVHMAKMPYRAIWFTWILSSMYVCVFFSFVLLRSNHFHCTIVVFEKQPKLTMNTYEQTYFHFSFVTFVLFHCRRYFLCVSRNVSRLYLSIWYVCLASWRYGSSHIREIEHFCNVENVPKEMHLKSLAYCR